MLGDVRELGGIERIAGLLLVLFAVAICVRLQTVAVALREREARSRFASNLRDVVNIAAAGSLFAAFLVCGLPVPGALLFAGTVTILFDVARHGGRTPGERAKLSLVVGLATALPVAIFAPQAMDAANAVAAALFDFD